MSTPGHFLDALASPRLWGAHGPRPRLFAWLLLIVATGWLVRAEVVRPELPRGVAIHQDLVYRESNGRRVLLDVLLPRDPAPAGGRPALIAIHGGGWRGGDKGEYGRSLAPLVRRGFAVVAVNYRLSRPGSPSWPDNLEDVRESVRWLRRHAAEFDVDPRRIGVIGASAGGHLALLLGNPTVDDQAHVSAIVDFYGPTDLASLAASHPNTRDAVQLLLGKTLNHRAEASPANLVTSTGPPVLIVHGSDDALVPLAQSRSLADVLQRHGVPHRLLVVEGSRHGFGLLAGPTDLTPIIIEFLDASWNDPQGRRPAAD